ncbi:MAG: hypothetical protein RJA09_2366 [Pseudomonadota bacterium]
MNVPDASPQPTDPTGAWPPLGLLRRRVATLVWAGGATLVVLGLFWTVFFGLRGAWAVAAIESGLVVLGLAVIGLVRLQRVQWAGYLLLGALWVVLVGFSLYLDVPKPGLPRTSHLFLLSVAVCAHYVLRENRPLVRTGVMAAYLLAFWMLASTDWGVASAYAIDPSVRELGGWFNAASALGVLLMGLYLMESDGQLRSRLEQRMRGALVAGRFELHYQPQVDAQGRLQGAEALLRWNDPLRGVVMPNRFIGLAESTGFILPLSRWVLHDACLQLARWRNLPGAQNLTLSVNISVHMLQQPDFVRQVLAELEATGAPAKRLKLEVTESTLVQDVDQVAAKMQALHDLGVGFSVDDFGTGYSSLSYLQRLPLHQLKIDRSFVRDGPENPGAAAITRTLVDLGRSLGMDVIAEGVETIQQRDCLLAQGCSRFQGFLYSRPLDIRAFEALLDQPLGPQGPLPASIHAANGAVKRGATTLGTGVGAG